MFLADALHVTTLCARRFGLGSTSNSLCLILHEPGGVETNDGMLTKSTGASWKEDLFFCIDVSLAGEIALTIRTLHNLVIVPCHVALLCRF